MNCDHLKFTLEDIGFVGYDQFPYLTNLGSTLQTRNIVHISRILFSK